MSLSDFEKFFENGDYSRLKRISDEIKLIKDCLRDELIKEETKRIEWRECGVVGKFRSVNRYDYNHIALNEYLFNLGILPVLSTVKETCLTKQEKQSIFEARKVDREDIVYFIPSKLTNLGSDKAKDFDLKINELSSVEKVILWKEKMVFKENLEEEWKALLKGLSWLLKQKEKTNITSMFGTITVKSKNLYSPISILELFGKDILIRSTRVRLEILEEYAAKGFLNMSEIKNFRKVVNVEQHFVLMELDKEERCKDWFSKRLNKLSELSRRRD
jgi:hypothetical protein